jgi:DNA-binding CsgD family transcriptional regulator
MAVQHVETLFERDEARAAIDELIDAVCRSDGSVLAFEAAAGLGKSSLVSIARERAAGCAMQVATARGGDLERDFPFGIVRQLVEPILARTSVSERQRLFEGSAQLAASVVGTPGQRPGAGVPDVGLPGQAAGPAMHGLYWLVANLAERDPLLLVVDDAHWGDTPSLRWLNYLARRLEGLPVALVLTARPGEPGFDSELFAALAAEPLTRVVQLEPLTREGSDRVVRRVLGDRADEAFCAACHAVSGGNPFLLEELTGALARDDVEPVEASAAAVHALVPDTVARSLVLRMARLPPAAAALARAVAVLGDGASLHDAGMLAELDDAAAAEAATTLAGVAILGPGLPLDFVHPIVRDAVYDDMPAAERAIRHARAARVLADAGATAERVAAQLIRAEPAGDAWVVARLRAAAADAIVRADPRTAAAFLRRAFVEPVSVDERVALLGELVTAGFAAAEPGAVDELGVDPVAELAADPEALQARALHLVMMLWSAGRVDAALNALDQARSVATVEGDRDRALLMEVRSIMLAQLLPGEACRRLELQAASVDHDSFAGRLLDASLGWYGGLVGRPASEALARLRRAYANGLLVGELRDDDVILGGHVLGLIGTDELGLSERIVEQMLTEGRTRGFAVAVGQSLWLNAYVAHRRGDLLRAEADVRAAAAAFQEGNAAAAASLLTALLVNTLTERGELDGAQSELAAAGMDGAIYDHWWFGEALCSRGYLRLAQGRTTEGIEDLLEFGRRYHRDGLVPTVARPWASHAAPLLAQRGQRQEASRLAALELKEARRWGTPRAIGQALRGVGLVTGGTAGIDLLRDAVRALEASPARLEHARALTDLGAALRRANQRSEARGPLRVGLDLAHRCGARLLAERATQELRATGARPRKPMLAGTAALTASERRIAELAAEGLTNREIAQSLFVTVKTIETHMGHVFQKLDVSSRQKLAPLLQ